MLCNVHINLSECSIFVSTKLIGQNANETEQCIHELCKCLRLNQLYQSEAMIRCIILVYFVLPNVLT